ncbi:MAG: hypothetical protein KatS3mg045_0590 [Bellilinea sp.]|nr:MAG: hypothetical protein KatS3mg045_0590 [Bellilinea sp.]
MIKRVVDAISGRVAGWRNWLKKQNPHLLGLVLVMAAFWAAMAFSEPVSPPQVTPLAPTVEVTPLPSQAATGETPVESLGPTPFPAELIANREQTFGIVFGAVVLVMIVIIGTLSGIAAQRQNESK